MKTVLITGGAGFIGAHVARACVESGCRVIVLDNFSTGRAQNIRHLLATHSFEMRRHDIREPYDVAADEVFNLASPASPPHYQRDPVGTTLTNVLGVYHGLQNAARHGARFLQASTSEVYGDPQRHPQTEDYRGNTATDGRRACYDESKRCAESLVMDFYRTRGVDVRIARIFNTYGPGMAPDDGRVVSNFIVQALSGQPLTLYGNGTQTRSLCYIDDLVDGLFGLMRQTRVVGPVNLGNPEEVSVRSIAERIIALAGQGRIVQRALPADDPKRRQPDIGLAANAFGFAPKTPLNLGLYKTVAYFRRILAAEPERYWEASRLGDLA